MKKYKSVKEMTANMTDNVNFLEELYESMDKSFKPIQILIWKEDKTYVATFNNIGGGTQASTINRLLNNCKEVIALEREVRETVERKKSKEIIRKKRDKTK